MSRFFLLALSVIVISVWANKIFNHPSVASSDSDGWRIGVLNNAKLLRSIQGISSLRLPYEQQSKAYIELINLRQDFLLLTGLEWAELRLLLSKSQRTKREEERLQQLRRVELEREAELQKLQQTPNTQLSSQEKVRLEELTKTWKEGRNDLERLKGLIDEELKRMEETYSKAVDEKLRQAVQKVANEHSLDFVLDSKAIYFSKGQMTDITDKVFTTINELMQNTPNHNTNPKGGENEAGQ